LKVYIVVKGWHYDGESMWAVFDSLAKAEHEKSLLEKENLESRRPSSSFYVDIHSQDVL